MHKGVANQIDPAIPEPGRLEKNKWSNSSLQALKEITKKRLLNRKQKGRLRPMLGFKTFYNARRVIIGIELAQKIHKRQFAIPITLQSNPAVTWRHVMAA